MLAYNLSFAAVVGLLTVILAVLVKIIGIPDQIRHNYRRQSTEGVSSKFFVLAFLSYVFWTIHGVIKKDAVVVIGQFMGVITTGIVLYQVMRYRKRGK